MGQFPRNSEPERALCADTASLHMIMNRGATTTDCDLNSGADAEDPNAWASTLDEMALDNKNAGISEDRFRNMSARAVSSVINEETICHILTTGYCAATNEIEDFSFLFVERVVTKVIYRGVLDETLN